MKELRFRYSNVAYTMILWALFVLILIVSLSTVSYLTNFANWIVEILGLTGLIVVVLLAIALFVIIFLGSYFYAVKLTDKVGLAIISEECVEIIMGNKHIKIYYAEIIKMNCKYLIFRGNFFPFPPGFKMKIKTRYIATRITGSLKERFENIKNRHKYKSTLEMLYDEIYSILDKNKEEYMMLHFDEMIRRGELK